MKILILPFILFLASCCKEEKIIDKHISCINLSLDISSGVYFVSLIREGKLINTQKWIVIR